MTPRQQPPSLLGIVALICLAGAGCTPLEVDLGTDDRRVPCGTTLCEPDFYCCNESCGICAPPGTGCITAICGGDCDPQDVRPIHCIAPAVLGYAWNGATCALLSGCACDGTDCGELYPTQEACEMARISCLGGARMCTTNDDCASFELCDFATSCGSTGTTGFCRPAAISCTGIMEPTCGCDGLVYASPCDAELARVDTAFMGPCDPGTFACDAITCRRYTEICVLSTAYPASCEPVPTDCPDSPCDCAFRTGSCTDDAAGGVTIERSP